MPKLPVVGADVPTGPRQVRHALPAPQYSPFKAIHHPERLAALRKGWRFPPAHVNIDLVSGPCSHRCVYCAPPDEVAVLYTGGAKTARTRRHDALAPGMRLVGGNGNPRTVVAVHPHKAYVIEIEVDSGARGGVAKFRIEHSTPMYGVHDETPRVAGSTAYRGAPVQPWRVRRGDCLYAIEEPMCSGQRGGYVAMVLSTRELGWQDVIGVTVEGEDHTYCIGPNIVSHNCVGTDPRGFGMDTAARHSDKAMDDLQLFPPDRLLPMLEELVDVGCEAFEFTGLSSEPTLHPKFVEALAFLRGRGMPYGVITNGDRLVVASESGKVHATAELDYLSCAAYARVSVDSLDEAVDRRIRNPRPGVSLPLEMRLRGVETLAGRAEGQRVNGLADCTVGVGVVVQRANVENDGILRLLRWAFAAGVNVVRLVWVQGDVKLRGSLLRDEDMAEARRQVAIARAELDGRVTPGFTVPFRIFGPGDYDSTLGAGAHDKAYSKCRYVRFVCNITAEGDVYGCCQQRDVGRLKYGNIVEQPAAAIFYGEERERVLGSIDVNRDPVCAACIWDRQNEAIAYAAGENVKHAGFV